MLPEKTYLNLITILYASFDGGIGIGSITSTSFGLDNDSGGILECFLYGIHSVRHPLPTLDIWLFQGEDRRCLLL